MARSQERRVTGQRAMAVDGSEPADTAQQFLADDDECGDSAGVRLHAGLRPKARAPVPAAGIDWLPVVTWLVDDMHAQTDFNAFFASYMFEINHNTWTQLLLDAGPHNTRNIDAVHRRIAELHEYQRDYYANQLPSLLSTYALTALGDFSTEAKINAVQTLAQTLYYTEYFRQYYGEPAPEPGSTYSLCMDMLREHLEPYIGEMILGSGSTAAQRAWTDQGSKAGTALAVVNTITLFARVLGLVSDDAVRDLIQQIRTVCVVENHGALNLYSKITVLTHIGLNFRGQIAFEQVAWVFEFFDEIQVEIIQMFDDESNANRDILLDLVAEIITCYNYSRHFTPALANYVAFVGKEVERKYARVAGAQFCYRYYAHADVPSDHESVSLYHMLMSQPRNGGANSANSGNSASSAKFANSGNSANSASSGNSANSGNSGNSDKGKL